MHLNENRVLREQVDLQNTIKILQERTQLLEKENEAMKKKEKNNKKRKTTELDGRVCI